MTWPCLLLLTLAPEPLPAGPGNNTAAAWSPDGTQVVFQTDRAGDADLYLLDLAAGQAKPLVTGPGHAICPAWSADGRFVLYSFARFETTAEGVRDGYNLFRVPAAGGEPERLTSGLERDYGVAPLPAGRLLFGSTRGTKENGVDLVTLAPGGQPEPLWRTGGIDALLALPALSPDGRTIACGSIAGIRGNWTLRLIDLRDPARQASLTDADTAFYGPRWAPDGRRLAATGYVPGDPGWGVWVLDSRTGGRVRVETGPGNSRSPAWSPDGRFLIYEQQVAGRYQLHRVAAPTAVPPPPAVPATATPPVASYRFTAPGRVTDASAAANHLQPHGTPTPADGGLRLTAGCYWEAPQPRGLDFGSGAFTVRAVVRLDEHLPQLRHLVVGDYPGNRLGWQLYLNPDGKVMFNSRDTALIYRGASSDSPLALGRRVELRGVRTAAGAVQLYVDGVPQGAATAGATVAYPTPTALWVGCSPGGANPFLGTLYELSLTPRAVTADELRGAVLERFFSAR